MGIDVYARWDGQTREERQAQYTGFSVTAGRAGYLREAYHGGPYATHVLFPECFEGTGTPGEGPLSHSTRRYLGDDDDGRLHREVQAFRARYGINPAIANREDVLEKLASWWDAPPEDVGYDEERGYWRLEYAGERIPAASLIERLPAALEAAAERQREIYPDDSPEHTAAVLGSFVDFVELYETLEADGRSPAVLVSY